MMKTLCTVVAVLLAFGACPVAGHAQQAEFREGDVAFTLGTRTWFSTGYSTSSIAAGGINPISELTWRGVDSVVFELNGELRWRRLVLLGSVGGGSITEGVLIDDDFAASGRSGRFSHTRSDVDDENLFYANADVGFRLLDWSRTGRTLPGYVDGLVGYQHWRERYVSFGATGFPNVVPSGLAAVSNEYIWNSIRVGGRTQIPLFSRLGLRLRGYALPWSWFELDDVHSQRADLKKNPSFRDEATGGIGVQADGGLVFTLWRGLSLEVGYQYWKLDSGSGDSFTRTVAGTFRSKLNRDTTERYGPFIGLQYRF